MFQWTLCVVELQCLARNQDIHMKLSMADRELWSYLNATGQSRNLQLHEK